MLIRQTSRSKGKSAQYHIRYLQIPTVRQCQNRSTRLIALHSIISCSNSNKAAWRLVKVDWAELSGSPASKDISAEMTDLGRKMSSVQGAGWRTTTCSRRTRYGPSGMERGGRLGGEKESRASKHGRLNGHYRVGGVYVCSVEVLDYMENHAVSQGCAVYMMRRMRICVLARRRPKIARWRWSRVTLPSAA